MKSISNALQSHLNSETTTLATLVKVTRADGVVKGFTTWDRNLMVDGILYKADGAMTPSALQSTAGLATDNLDITGILNSSDITASDIENGLYDHARVDMYVCNWADLTQGTLQLRRGWIGTLSLSGDHYVAELRGLHDLLQRPIGSYYTPECRYDLGDNHCSKSLTGLTVTGAVSVATDQATFSDFTRSESDGYFNYGKLTWTSGANSGLSIEVKNYDGAGLVFNLWLPMPYAIGVGDTYSLYPGCDKRFATCRDKFANAVNFGGFPYLPGVGNILKYPNGR